MVDIDILNQRLRGFFLLHLDLNGVKQILHAWFMKVTRLLTSYVIIPYTIDPIMFINDSVNVDEILLIDIDDGNISSMKVYIH